MNMMREDYSLEDLLKMAVGNSQHNCLAYCLGKSRSQQPTQLSMQLTLELIISSNDIRWIEVLERQALMNYQLAFHLCKDIPLVYPTLLQMNLPTQNQQEFAYLTSAIINLFTTNDHHMPSQLKWNAFVALIKVYQLKIQNISLLQSFMGHFNALLSDKHVVSDFQSWKKAQLTSTQMVDDSIYCVSAFEVILTTMKIYKKMCKKLRSSMRYLLFKANNSTLIYWLCNNLLQMFSLSPSIIKPPFQKHFYKTPMPLKLLEDLILCLIQSKEIPEMQILLMNLHSTIVQTLLNNNLITYDGKGVLDIEDQLNWQYGLINRHFGQDLPSYITQLTLSLTSFPGFLQLYLQSLHQTYQLHHISENQAIMKLSVLHQPISLRKDLTYRIVQPIISNFTSNFAIYNNSLQSQISFCRKLRLLFLFFQFLKESQIIRFIELITFMLKTEQYTSFCFKEGFLLLERLDSIVKTENNKNRHISSIVQTIKEQVHLIMNELINIVHLTYSKHPLNEYSEQRQGKLTKIYQLIELILDSNQAEVSVEKILPQLVLDVSDWICGQFEGSDLGRRRSMVLDLLIRIAKKIIGNIKQDYYIDLATPIYKILSLLKHPSALDHQQQLLQILLFVLDSQKSINSTTCTILLSLKPITKQHSFNIYPIRSILKMLCSQKISQSIMYQWNDLCIFIVNLFLQYFQQFMHGDYPHLYREEWKEIVNTFGMFLQVYDEIIDRNVNVQHQVLCMIDQIKEEQIQLQLLLVINFKRNGRIKSLCNATNIIIQLKCRKTFKLIILYYCNLLSNQYDELILNQLIQCHRIYKEKQWKQDFEPELASMEWPYLNTKIEGRTLQVLRRLRKQGHIDHFQFNQMVGQLNFT